jgi:3-deoxy-D-manno-octulosonic acid kinase
MSAALAASGKWISRFISVSGPPHIARSFWHARGMAIQLQPTTTGAILYDSDRVLKPTEEIFESTFWEGNGKIVARASGRGAAIFIRDAERDWVLRHYRRGGLVARVLGDRYLWLGAERTRAFREWRLLHDLHARGFPVPAPVATRYVRAGFCYRADLLTTTLPAARTLSDSIAGAFLKEAIWRAIGATIARFHGAGVHHADLNAHNILLAEGGAVYVLDFDRGRIRERGAWEQAVLSRLHRSLLKVRGQRPEVRFEQRNWQELLDGYERQISAM